MDSKGKFLFTSRGHFGALIIMIATVLTTSLLHAQVIENTSDTDLMYTNITDAQGNNTCQLFLSKGKVYIQGGKVAYGTSKQRLKNVDGKGQYISVAPSALQQALMNKVWVLGFRVDEMRFHWEIDSERLDMAIVVDAITIHDKNVTAMVAGKKQTCQAGEIAFNNRENGLIITNVTDLPYAAGRSYILDSKPKAQIDGKAPEAKQKESPKETKLVVKEDGTISAQDVLVHLTSPVDGEPETLLRNVTITNQFKDRLALLEIREKAGTRTALVFCDKGQSMHFDAQGVPNSGQGKFKVEAVGEEKAQLVAGWLGSAGSAHGGKRFKSATLEFVQTPKNGTQSQLSDFVEATVNTKEAPKAEPAASSKDAKP